MLTALRKELELRAPELEGESLKTIYFGGGTPSLLSVSELASLFEVIYKNYRVVASPEITLEANPDDLSSEKITQLSKTKINRLSIGIQSFFDDDLQFMNRAHTASEAKKSLTTALTYFDNITIDLIYGLPQMSSKKWLRNLQIAFDFQVPHISSYALTVEKKTALHAFIQKGKVPSVSESKSLEHFNLLVASCESQGLVQYEISNFGKPDYFSKHNTSYWKGEKYLGIGPSAHSFNTIERAWNISNNANYIRAIQKNELPLTIEKLTINDRFNEYVMTGLRTVWGVSLPGVIKNYGAKYATHLKRNAQKFTAKNLLEFNDKSSCFVLTKKGKFLADGIASDLFII